MQNQHLLSHRLMDDVSNVIIRFLSVGRESWQFQWQRKVEKTTHQT